MRSPPDLDVTRRRSLPPEILCKRLILEYPAPSDVCFFGQVPTDWPRLEPYGVEADFSKRLLFEAVELIPRNSKRHAALPPAGAVWQFGPRFVCSELLLTSRSACLTLGGSGLLLLCSIHVRWGDQESRDDCERDANCQSTHLRTPYRQRLTLSCTAPGF